MKINNLNNTPLIPNSKNIPVSKDEKGNSVKDSIKISSEARELINGDKAAKINEIKQKLSENFYSRKEVIEKTAEAILKDIKGTK